MEIYKQLHGNSMCLFYTSEWRLQVYWKHLKEEADAHPGRGSCRLYFPCTQHPTRNGFTIPWIWGTQVLDTEEIISTISIHSELHLIATVFWNVLQNDPFLESNSSSWRHSDEAHKNQFILLTFPKPCRVVQEKEYCQKFALWQGTCHKRSLWLCDTPEGTFLFDDR